MKKAMRSAAYVFGVWGGVALVSGLAALIGNVALSSAGAGTIATVTAIAAGAILAMLVDTMIPEATAATRDYSGLIAVVGFLATFVLRKVGG